MNNLMRRGEELARAAQKRRIERLAARLSSLVRGVSVGVEEARVLVSGRGLLRRWLIDPELRFLTSDRR